MDNIRKILEAVAKEHTYKIPSRRETYDKYNEGWTDAVNRIESMLPEQTETQRYLGSPCEYQNPNVEISYPEPKWIPCSERMPEEHEWIGTKQFGTTISDEVYVTFENEKGERFCKHMKFQNRELSLYDKAFMDTWFKGGKPIAWMPLPEPYKEGEKNDKR